MKNRLRRAQGRTYSQEPQAFKENFHTEYGHFYCKFENTEALKYHLVLQLESYLNCSLTKIEDLQIKIDGKTIAHSNKYSAQSETNATD